VISHFPPHRIYIEPFGGAASVLLRKERSYVEVYNDLDDGVVNLFRVMRDDPAPLIRALELTPYSRREFEQACTKVLEPIESARRLIVRSYMGFGSDVLKNTVVTGFRGQAMRNGTTPAMDWRNLPAAYTHIADRLRGVVIENRDAIKLIGLHDTLETLCYCDPPYLLSTRKENHYHGYNHEMTDDQHRELAEVLQGCKGMVIISGYPSGLYEELYASWHQVRRNSRADGARKRTEVLWINQRAIECTGRWQIPLFG
jgi:DNA adenine methylase